MTRYGFTTPTNVVTVEPTVEPVGLADVRANAYIIDNETDNDFITNDLIPSAREVIENMANRSFITQTRRQSYDFMPDSPIFLRFGPTITVTGFTYVDTNGVSQTLAATEYDVDAARVPGRICEAYQKTWPVARDQVNSVNITYTAGYGAAGSSVPRAYRRAIILLCKHWYDNRDAFAVKEADAVMHRLSDLIATEGRTVEYA
jgi:uncharacterized phiE125 gp8 family phage protein